MLDFPTENPIIQPPQYENTYKDLQRKGKNPPPENSPKQLLTEAQKCCRGLTIHSLDTFINMFNRPRPYNMGPEGLSRIAREVLIDMEEMENLQGTNLTLLNLESVILRANFPMVTQEAIQKMISEAISNHYSFVQVGLFQKLSQSFSKSGYHIEKLTNNQRNSLCSFFSDSIRAEEERLAAVVKT